MRRFLKVVLIILALFAIAYFGYKELQQTSSLLGKVHVNADSAIKIGIHDIKETLILDALAAPLFYYEQTKFSKSDDEDAPDKGIDLSPYNLVLFTVPDIENTFFGTLEIKDSKSFEAYIAKELEKKSATVDETPNSDYQFAKIEKSKIILAWNTEQLVFALALDQKPESFHSIFKDVLTDGKTISDGDHSLITALADHDNHVIFANSSGNITLDFEDGKALIAGNILTDNPQRFQSEISIDSIPDTSFMMYLDANFENALNKEKVVNVLESVSFFQKNALNVSELANRTNGFLSLAIAGTTKQLDTVITYDYDDNFEKVEELSLQERQVPKAHITLGGENQSLKDYLIAQKAIDTNGIFKPFPLYTLYVKEGSMNTVFDTFEENLVAQKQLSSSFFGCRIDFRKLTADMDVPRLGPYVADLREMKVFATQKEGNQVMVHGELTATHPNINILSQLALKKPLDSIQ
ncbi:hypothetical protein FGM00_18505 [Aggregatimonas sangjinii]|uniref:Uncharacterized protein n=1 Tax=Aggregatimonas sangjinii TaxID=2583587 RepID=A0A5B7STY1_9FLAO|nr:hypothetical protein [Aggregatimonas sangjinii]QCX02007.1 hypothetical protein FGM00_18505 [Aggregatimonas sangjinii]